MKPITIQELHEYSSKLGVHDLILDVRTPQEYSEGHVPGSKNIPVDQVESRWNELQGKKNLYVYCRAGRRADTAAAILSGLGLTKIGINSIFVVDNGGFPDWEAARFPIQK